MDHADRISRRLKLRQLEVLQAVAHCGSMAKAAQQIGITQPVVSKTIADLEATLDLRLFDRTAQGVEPTRYGLALLARSTAMFNELRLSVSELEFLSDPTRGDLRVGSSEAVAAGLLGVILDEMSRRHPQVTFEISLGADAAELPYGDLRAKSIDLIIGRLPKEIPDDLEAQKLFMEQALIVAGQRHPLTRRRKVELKELSGEAWCGPSFDSFPWSLIGDSFRSRNLELPRRIVRVRSILARNSLLATGRFITNLPWSVLHFGPQGQLIKRIAVELPKLTYPVGVMTLKSKAPHPLAGVFMSCAQEVVTSLKAANRNGPRAAPSR